MMADQDLSRRHCDHMTKPLYFGEASGRREEKRKKQHTAVVCLLATTPITSNILAKSSHQLPKIHALTWH